MSRSEAGAIAREWPSWLAAVGAILVAFLAVAVSADLTDGFDATVIEVVRADAWAAVLWPLRWITELGSTGGVTAVAAISLLLGVSIGGWRLGVLSAVTIGLASLAVEGMKEAIARVRPDALEPIVVERGFSFPSGHATLSMVAYGILAVLIIRSHLPAGARRAAPVALGVLILLIGISRVWLGAHYPTDVLAGWIAGAVVVVVYARFTRSASPAPAAASADADPAAPRFDPPGPG